MFNPLHNDLTTTINSVLEDRTQLIEIIKNPASPEAKAVLNLANQVRLMMVGNDVHLRGLIEISNYCRNNCLYCGIRRDNSSLTRYRMTVAEIVATAQTGAGLGFKTIVLQSGEDPFYSAKMLAEAIEEIPALGLVVTLSLGERHPNDYELWYQAGARRYLMRHETANPVLYQKLHPGQSLEHRIQLLKILKEIGYQVGSGFMVGLPQQTPEDLISDLELLKELDADMVGIGPFIPHPKTPLGVNSQGDLALTLLMVALARLTLPEALIPATTALGSIHPQGRELALQAGANVVMPNLTPVKYRSDYELYPNKICTNESATHCHGCITTKIYQLGRTVATDFGHNQKWLRRQNHA